MLIVDAQVHIWAANTPERPWPARHQPHRPVPIERGRHVARDDTAGVDRVGDRAAVRGKERAQRRGPCRRTSASGPLRGDEAFRPGSAGRREALMPTCAQAARHARTAFLHSIVRCCGRCSPKAALSGCGRRRKKRACRS